MSTKKRHLYLIFLLASLLLLVSCSEQLCSELYIEYKKGECCLDSNSNSICDKDEKEKCPFDCCVNSDYQTKTCPVGVCEEGTCELSRTYNGYKFTPVQSDNVKLWEVEINSHTKTSIPFYYHPQETSSVSMQADLNSITSRNGPDLIYLTLYPDAGSDVVIAGVEIARILGNRYDLFNIETRAALQKAVEGTEINNPVITCDDASSSTTVLSFESGDTNRITQDEENLNCFQLVYVGEEDAIKVADRFAYTLLGIYES